MIQGSEFFVILLVALVVMGPQRLPEMARKVGRWTAELRRTAADLRAGLEAEVGDLQEISRELKAPLGEVTTVAKDTADAANQAIKPVSRGGPTPRPAPATDADEVHGNPLAWTGPTPTSGPTAEDAMSDLEEIDRTGRPLSDTPATGPQEPVPEAAVEEGAGADDADHEGRRPPREATG